VLNASKGKARAAEASPERRERSRESNCGPRCAVRALIDDMSPNRDTPEGLSYPREVIGNVWKCEILSWSPIAAILGAER
jgi:hypothetical protein